MLEAKTSSMTGTVAEKLAERVAGTVIAFDFGLKRIGVAVGNTMIQQAQVLTIIEAPTNDAKFIAIEKIIKDWQPILCVVGLPMHPDGVAHEMTIRCQRFANQLHGRFGVQIALVDERYTSAVLKAKQGEYIDDQSAALILQQYFDQQR